MTLIVMRSSHTFVVAMPAREILWMLGRPDGNLNIVLPPLPEELAPEEPAA